MSPSILPRFGEVLLGRWGPVSTARDDARFAPMWLDGGECDGARLLKPGTIRGMTTNRIGGLYAPGGLKYGLGFSQEPAPGPMVGRRR